MAQRTSVGNLHISARDSYYQLEPVLILVFSVRNFRLSSNILLKPLNNASKINESNKYA